MKIKNFFKKFIEGVTYRPIRDFKFTATKLLLLSLSKTINKLTLLYIGTQLLSHIILTLKQFGLSEY